MLDQPSIRITYGCPPEGAEVFVPSKSKATAALAVASREAAEREVAYLRALNAPRMPALELPRLKKPVLAPNFQARLDTRDEEIYKRGIGISRQRLLSLGRQRFTDLLTKDHAARSVQRVIRSKTDLTHWSWVEFAFAAVNGLTTPIRKRRTAEVYAGSGIDREAAAKITGFADLWKVNQNQQTVRDVYAFYDAFVSLGFAQSLLERLHDDGRARSYSFCGGSGRKPHLFTDWLGALQGSHFTVRLNDPLWHTVSWLANERTPPPTALAQDFLGVRAPSRNELAFCDTVWHGFLLGYSSWALWDYVGRATRQVTDVEVLETWRRDLARRYPVIQGFHDELRAAFHRPVSSAAHGHYQFDEAGYRKFIDHNIEVLLNRLSGLLALALEETLPGTIVARFQYCWLLCEVNTRRANNYPKNFLDADIGEKLETVFPGQRFYSNQFKIEELPG